MMNPYIFLNISFRPEKKMLEQTLKHYDSQSKKLLTMLY